MLPANLMGILLAPWGQRFLYPDRTPPQNETLLPSCFPQQRERLGADLESAL